MMKKILSAVIFTGFLAAVSGSNGESDKQVPEKSNSGQTNCPVMVNRKVNKDLFVDHNGKRIYVCCTGCLKKVIKDPEKFIKKLEQSGQTVEKTPSLSLQKTCPVMGGEIDRDLFVDHKEQRIYVCCSGCIDAVKENPEMFIKKLSEMGQNTEKISMGEKRN